MKNGAPGEIRTPDHLVRSQIVESVDRCPIKAVTGLLRSSYYRPLRGGLRGWQTSASGPFYLRGAVPIEFSAVGECSPFLTSIQNR